MIAVGNALVDKKIFSKEFICNLNACKGECCVAGDSGAPLEREELPVLISEFEKIKPFLSEKGIAAIESQGLYVKDWEGDYTTPLIEGAECAYTVFEDGIASCGIEKAWKAGATDFRKPVSCHLYPIRVSRLQGFEKLHYHEWSVCSAACELGRNAGVKVYKFLKDALVRRFGEDFYNDLEKAEELLNRKSSGRLG